MAVSYGVQHIDTTLIDYKFHIITLFQVILNVHRWTSAFSLFVSRGIAIIDGVICKYIFSLCSSVCNSSDLLVSNFAESDLFLCFRHREPSDAG